MADFDPEEDVPEQDSDDSGSEDSDDGLGGTEHYAQVGYVMHHVIIIISKPLK